MKKQLFVVSFCSVLLILVGLLWWRIRELEKIVNSVRYLPVANSTVGWQDEQQSKNDSPKKQVFKLIDSPEPADPEKTKVGVPWNVERAMMGEGGRNSGLPQEGETHWEVQASPDVKPVVIQPDSK